MHGSITARVLASVVTIDVPKGDEGIFFRSAGHVIRCPVGEFLQGQ